MTFDMDKPQQEGGGEKSTKMDVCREKLHQTVAIKSIKQTRRQPKQKYRK